MEDIFPKILQEIIPLRPSEGQCKLMPLGQALRKHVQPGLTLHLGITSTPPTAILYELTRLFRGKDPRFTLAHWPQRAWCGAAATERNRYLLALRFAD